MKRLIVFILLIVGSFQVKSQSTISATLATGKFVDESAIQTNAQRYKIDYEIKEWANNPLIDEEKLKKLNLDYYDAKRKKTEDYEEYDTATGLTVIVYSIQKTDANQPQ